MGPEISYTWQTYYLLKELAKDSGYCDLPCKYSTRRTLFKDSSSSISLNVVDNKMELELIDEDSNVDHDEELEVDCNGGPPTSTQTKGIAWKTTDTSFP